MSESPPKKKQRVSFDLESSSPHVKDFKITEVLKEEADLKMICLRGVFDNHPGDAVVNLEKEPFDEQSVKEVLRDGIALEETRKSDAYSTAKILLPKSCNVVKATVTFPASASNIDKNRHRILTMINETPHQYRNTTLPYIQSAGLNVKWVYNILAKKAESERIIYEDPDPTSGFILLPDIKWNGSDMNSLHLIAIVQDRRLCSIRDLTAQHLGLLQNIRDSGTAAIMQKYGVGKAKIITYLHYLPSSFHLLVHFSHVDYDGPGREVERTHLLEDVIANIGLDGDIYLKKTLSFCVKEGHVLQHRFS